MSILCFVVVVHGEITKNPENVVGVVGNNVTLNCTGRELNWEEYTSNKGHPTKITGSRGEVYFPKEYDLKMTSTREYNLIIKFAKLRDAGEYRCISTEGGNSYKSVQLIMFNGKIFAYVTSLVLFHNYI